jgi:hypothetical protein
MLALAATPPPFVPSGFVARVDNPWFPLIPGTVYVYRGAKDGRASRDVVTVTRRSKRIEGVRAIVVDDRLYEAGRLASGRPTGTRRTGPETSGTWARRPPSSTGVGASRAARARGSRAVTAPCRGS